MKVLLAGVADKRHDLISAAQLEPLFRQRRALARDFGVNFAHAEVDQFPDIVQACRRHATEVSGFIVRPTWRAPADEAVASMAELRREFPEHRIVFIDPWDQATGRYLGVLPHVDKLMKYHRFRNRDDYYRDWIGGTVITDYFVRELGYDLEGWHAGSVAPPGTAQRIMTGWHLTTTLRYRWELFRPQVWPLVARQRDIDIVCHVSYGRKDSVRPNWYARHRMTTVEQLREMGNRYRIAVSGEFDEERSVSRAQYLHDMNHARIAVSPFGWGEIPWRDYEAVCKGNLLVKPRVDHIRVQPDIYVPGVTYVPVKWDMSDLQETCRYYLDNWDRAVPIIEAARRAYKAFFENRVALQITANALGLKDAQRRGQPLPWIPDSSFDGKRQVSGTS